MNYTINFSELGTGALVIGAARRAKTVVPAEVGLPVTPGMSVHVAGITYWVIRAGSGGLQGLPTGYRYVDGSGAVLQRYANSTRKEMYVRHVGGNGPVYLSPREVPEPGSGIVLMPGEILIYDHQDPLAAICPSGDAVLSVGDY